jgi:hypothetical protein
MLVCKFPDMKDHGNKESYLAALEDHFGYIKRETERVLELMADTPPSSQKEPWVDETKRETIHVTVKLPVTAESRMVGVDNLVGYATHLGKHIRRVCLGEMTNEGERVWCIFAELE